MAELIICYKTDIFFFYLYFNFVIPFEIYELTKFQKYKNWEGSVQIIIWR
jgi:hypothetical protein